MTTKPIRLRWAMPPRSEAGGDLVPAVRRFLAPGTTLDLPEPVGRGPLHLEYHFYQALIMVDLLRSIKTAENLGYDGAIIGCFYDPGLREAREITESLVVTAPAESAMHIAAHLGHKFSIIVGRRKWIPRMHENVVNYGFAGRLASFRAVEMGVIDFHRDERLAVSRIRQQAEAAIREDHAEVIILGCTMQYGFFKELQSELGVPVIDAAVAAAKYAEFLVGLRRAAGWSHSKVGDYESPPVREVKDWGLERDYNLGELWVAGPGAWLT